MNHTLSEALHTADRADRDARYLSALELPPLEIRAYTAKPDVATGDWIVVARGGRECLRLSAGTPDAEELAKRSAAQLNRRAWGRG